MMEQVVEIISNENIKPSSPTTDSQRLRHYQLSFLDQISPPVFMPFILLYQPNNFLLAAHDDLSTTRRLKKSLADTLTRFYPLAGRLVDNVFIDCTDEGVPFFEARTKCRLSDVLKTPIIPSVFNEFLPRELDDHEDGVILAVQATFFECGALALGVCTSHKIADALSMVMFITAWAAASSSAGAGSGENSGDNFDLCPLFESAKFFPPKKISGYEPTVGITRENIDSKRFVFHHSKVVALRERYTSGRDETGSGPIRPTRVEALSTFIWSRYAAVIIQENAGPPDKISVVLHAVNLRTRMDPPLSENSFGNLYRIAIATPLSLGTTEEERCRDLVKQMRGSLKSIDGGYVRQLQEGNEHLNFIVDKAERFNRGKMVPLNFTSLCRLPLYQATDFGWGKPVRVASTTLTFKNLVTFMDTPHGDGIEAWINMEQAELAKLEVDKEFLAYASTN